MKSTSFAVFPKGEQDTILKQFGFSIIKAERELLVMNAEGKQERCPACDKAITVKHFGTLAKGSRLLFCDNPVCITTWLAQKKI